MPTTNTAAATTATQHRPPNFAHIAEATTSWISANALEIIIVSAVGVGIYLLLRLLKGFGKRLRDHEGDPLGLSQLIGRAIAKTGHFFMIMVAARLVSGYAEPPAFVARTIAFLFTVAAVFQGAIWAREFILGFIERRTSVDGHSQTLANAMGIIRLLVTFALFAIATVVVLDNLGVNVTGLVAGLGIGGIAIGLAAQGIFSDLFAALSIIFDKPFRQGEIITYDQTTARVEKIGLKSTRLRAMSGEKKIISNANLLQKEITSLAHLTQRRVKFMLGVTYQTAPEMCERIPQLLRDAVTSEKVHFVQAGITGFGASSIDFELDVDVQDPDSNDFFQMRHRIALAVLALFNREGIDFAYPTQMSFTAAPDGRAIMPYPEPRGSA